ncbi:hypothetical protein WJX73_009995 [Symbiochloris irregularis]|uniref:Protein kinase domain-containing protein n=1 Tax=Symbiochloris irregularis TaxID=706552 RepID=A0AAW1NU90_9CHLO
MHRSRSGLEPVDSDIAFQKAILAAMADTWRQAQASRKHTSQATILLQVTDRLIKTPTNLRGIVDNIHETAVDRCREGTLESWYLWRFYLSALGERLKAGEYQAQDGREDTTTLCELARAYTQLREQRHVKHIGPQEAKAITFSDVCAACNIQYTPPPGLNTQAGDQMVDVPSFNQILRREINSPADLQIYEVPGPADDQGVRQATLAALPQGSEHLRDAAADLVDLCRSTAARATAAAGGVQLWKRLVRQLRTRLDRLAALLDPILQLGPGQVACKLPALQRLNSVTRESEALILDFSGADWVRRSWKRNHNPEDFLNLHRQLDECFEALECPKEATAPVTKETVFATATQDARELTTQLTNLQDELDQQELQPHLSPEESDDLRARVAACHMVCSKLEGGLTSSSSGARAVQFDGRDLSPGRQLGRGTYGKVHDATWLGMPVIVKMLDIRVDDVGIVQERLMAEARRLSAVQHPHLVQLLGINLIPSKRRFELVSERMACSLAQAHMDEQAALQGGNTLLQAARKVAHILVQIASALAFLHQHNIVMMDLKPSNVMLSSTDGLAVKISDYGFEAARERSSALGRRASSFMAPELRQGQHRDSQRANIFSLGVIGDELIGLLAPAGNKSGSLEDRHRGLRALMRLLATCQSPDPTTRPPASVVAHHLQLIKTLLLDDDTQANDMDLIPIDGDALLAQKGRATPSDTPSTPVSRGNVPDSARDHAWASAMFVHSQPEVRAVDSGDDDSAFAVKSHPDLIQAKREKRELKRQVHQLRSQLSQLQEVLHTEAGSAALNASGETLESSSEGSDDEEESVLSSSLNILNVPPSPKIHVKTGRDRPPEVSREVPFSLVPDVPTQPSDFSESSASEMAGAAAMRRASRGGVAGPAVPAAAGANTPATTRALSEARPGFSDPGQPMPRPASREEVVAAVEREDAGAKPLSEEPSLSWLERQRAAGRSDDSGARMAEPGPGPGPGPGKSISLGGAFDAIDDKRLDDRRRGSGISEATSIREIGAMDTLMLNEKVSMLQRHNHRLQAQILSMEDVSDRLSQLEELNRQLARDNERLARQSQMRNPSSVGANAMYQELRSEAERLKKELMDRNAENEELTGDNIKLLNYLESMNVVR